MTGSKTLLTVDGRTLLVDAGLFQGEKTWRLRNWEPFPVPPRTVDAVVLMSESCILGPQSHSHVRCREWTADLVLFRRGDELMCRTQSPVEIDGQTCVGQAAVAAIRGGWGIGCLNASAIPADTAPIPPEPVSAMTGSASSNSVTPPVENVFGAVWFALTSTTPGSSGCP